MCDIGNETAQLLFMSPWIQSSSFTQRWHWGKRQCTVAFTVLWDRISRVLLKTSLEMAIYQ